MAIGDDVQGEIMSKQIISYDVDGCCHYVLLSVCRLTITDWQNR